MRPTAGTTIALALTLLSGVAWASVSVGGFGASDELGFFAPEVQRAVAGALDRAGVDVATSAGTLVVTGRIEALEGERVRLRAQAGQGGRSVSVDGPVEKMDELTLQLADKLVAALPASARRASGVARANPPPATVMASRTPISDPAPARPIAGATVGADRSIAGAAKRPSMTEPSPDDRPTLDQPPLVEKPPEKPAPVDKPPLDRAVSDEKPSLDKQAPVDRPPVDRPPVDKAPIEKAPVDKPPADKPPVEKAPVDQPPVEKAPVEKAPADRPPADKAPLDRPPADDRGASDGRPHEEPLSPYDTTRAPPVYTPPARRWSAPPGDTLGRVVLHHIGSPQGCRDAPFFPARQFLETQLQLQVVESRACGYLPPAQSQAEAARVGARSVLMIWFDHLELTPSGASNRATGTVRFLVVRDGREAFHRQLVVGPRAELDIDRAEYDLVVDALHRVRGELQSVLSNAR